MTFEKSVGLGIGASLALSATMAVVRLREETARRSGHKGTSLIPDGAGARIEYTFTGATDSPAGPIVVCENGLGAPLETWDWVERSLAPHARIVRYHRRGYSHSTSRRRPAELLSVLLDSLAPEGPVFAVSHSIGALVTSNALLESNYLRARIKAAVLVDGTDGALLANARSSPSGLARYRQMTVQEIVSSVSGVNRWTSSKIERDVEYRPDVQRAYITSASSPQSLLAAHREYVTEPIPAAISLASLDMPFVVLSASDNRQQQMEFAAKLQAQFSTVPGSSHRSIIGKQECAEVVAGSVRDLFDAKN